MTEKIVTKLVTGMHEEFDEIKRVTDAKVVKLRQEFDLQTILRNIDKKAD